VILRICWRGERARLAREALLLHNLPDDIPHVEVLDSGEDEGLAWMVTRRTEGEVLHDIWTDLSASERRVAITDIANALSSLHRWQVPDHVRTVLSDHERRVRSGPAAYVEAFLVPLPVGRLRPLVELLRRRAQLSAPLAVEIHSCLDVLEAFDPFSHDERTTVVHGDAHLRNVLWRDGQVSALLDFEWARLGPPDLELECFVRSHDVGALDEVAWLRDDYPQLYADPNIVERVRLYELAYLLRQQLAWGESEDVTPLQVAVRSADRITRLIRSPH